MAVFSGESSQLVSEFRTMHNLEEIKTCTLADLTELRRVSRLTFTDTFGAANTSEDLAEYLETAYNAQQLTKEMKQTTTLFYFILVDETVAGYLKVNWGQRNPNNGGILRWKLNVSTFYRHLNARAWVGASISGP